MATTSFKLKKQLDFLMLESKRQNKAEHHEKLEMFGKKSDTHGNVIYIVEQRDGFRIRKTKNSDLFQSVRDELQAFPNCRKDVCTCNRNTSIGSEDEKNSRNVF
jgi:hypothetical protein